jgi:hypothetical protein
LSVPTREPRCALDIDVAVDDGILHVITTHLGLAPGRGESRYSASPRLSSGTRAASPWSSGTSTSGSTCRARSVSSAPTSGARRQCVPGRPCDRSSPSIASGSIRPRRLPQYGPTPRLQRGVRRTTCLWWVSSRQSGPGLLNRR